MLASLDKMEPLVVPVLSALPVKMVATVVTVQMDFLVNGVKLASQEPKVPLDLQGQMVHLVLMVWTETKVLKVAKALKVLEALKVRPEVMV